ncbi:MAG TPA: NADH-quinone oxidoreductase subunit J [Gemmatimonadales bacterium]|nr:NADH-quinone oxidoreductase subunit J [Gemmatimonadales bacterium]
METAIFWLLSAVAVGAALLCITARSPVASALWLVLTLFAIAGLFVLLDAFFIGIIQVLVYAGAIMVLFLFVIMLLNLGRRGPPDLKGWFGRGVAFLLAAGLVLQFWVMVRLIGGPGGFAGQTAAYPLPPGQLGQLVAERGAVGFVAEPLLRQFLVPFEVASLVLLAAIVGAVVLAKRKI